MVSLKKQQLGIKRQKWFLRSSKEARRASRDKDFGRESGHKSTCGGIKEASFGAKSISKHDDYYDYDGDDYDDD